MCANFYIKIFSFVISFQVLFQLAWASSIDSNKQSAQFISLGRAGLAATGRNIEDTFILNPALLASKSGLGFFTSYAQGDLSVAQDQRQIGLGFLDSTSGSWDPKKPWAGVDGAPSFPVASALTYTNIKNDMYRDQHFNLGLAQAMSASLAVGILGNYSELGSRVGDKGGSYFDLGVGIIYRFRDYLSFGLSAQNLLDARKDFASTAHLRRALGLGTQVRLAHFFYVRADVWNSKDLNDENQWIYRIGLENNLSENFQLRLGFGRDNIAETHLVSAGFALIGPRLSLYYGFQKETSLDNVLHSVDFQVPLW